MIRRLAGSKLLRLFSTAVIDQALLSAANFAVGLLLIRYAPDHEYGYFVLAFSFIQLMNTAQGSWMTGPLAVLAPKQTAERRREMVGAVEHSQARFLRRLLPVVVLVPGAGALLGLWSQHDALIATATALAGWMALRREAMRAILMIYSRPQSVLRADVLYVLLLVGLAALAATLSPAAGVFAVLALGVAAASGQWLGRRALAQDPGLVATPAGPVWARLRPLGLWGTAGAVIYWVYSQSYNLVLASRIDLVAVANVNATRLMLMPMVLLMVGVSSLLVPNAAGWLHREGLSSLLRRLWLFLAGLLVLDAVYVLVLWFSRHWVVGTVMRKTIPGLDLMLVLWAVHLSLSMFREVFQTAVSALERFRPMAWLSGTAALISLAVMWLAIGRYGAPGALMGTIAGEVVSLMGVGLLLTQSWKQARVAERA